MNFSSEEIEEFKTEAKDLLDSAEEDLLKIESDGSFSARYDAVFRVFHGLKGGGGMLGLALLRNHMHSIESIFSKLKSESAIDKAVISFFLKGVDAARRILGGEEIQFNYELKREGDDARGPEANVEAVSSIHNATERAHAPVVYAVDDEPEMLTLIKEILDSAKIECRTFSDPREAVTATKKHPPAAMLVDMKMLQMDGLQVLKEVKKIDPHLPVLFVSGYLDKRMLLESIDHGIFAAIEKPFDIKNLLSHVLSAIRYRRLSKLLNRSVNLLMYQFTDLDNFLQEHGKEDIRKAISNEMKMLMEHKRDLRHHLKGVG